MNRKEHIYDDEFYHVYNHGNNHGVIFRNEGIHDESSLLISRSVIEPVLASFGHKKAMYASFVRGYLEERIEEIVELAREDGLLHP